MKNSVPGVGRVIYRAQSMLSKMPYLRSLDAKFDLHKVRMPESKEWLNFVPHLRALRIYQCDSDQTNNEKSIIPIRETLEFLTELESLTLEELHLSTQDMIYIACHPTSTAIKLISETVNYHDLKWFDYDVDFDSESEQRNKKRKILQTKNNSEPEFPHDDKFGVEGDTQYECHDEICQEATPERMADDIARIEQSLLLPSSPASQRARLQLINYLMTKLFQPRTSFSRPISYLCHLRRQLFMLHSALSESVEDRIETIKSSNLIISNSIE